MSTGGSDVRSGGLRRVLGGPGREMLLGGGAAVASMIPIARFARDFWFRYDNFELVANRRIGSLNDYFRPHGDHWLTWTIVVSRGLYGLVGMDYWPWWFIPRLIGHAVVAFGVWRVLVYRGADRTIAFLAYLALLVLAVSYFQDALTVANYVLFPCLLAVALIVGEVDVPRRRDLLIVGACLVVAVAANGYGIALVLAVAVVVAIRRRFRRWAPALVPPAVLVGAWYVWYRSDRLHHRHSSAFVFKAIGSSFVVMRSAVENTLGLPGPLAVVALVAIAAFAIWLVNRRRLDTFDAIIGVTLVVVLGILAWARTTQTSRAETVRYGYVIVLLLTLVLVPHLRLPVNRLARTAVVSALVAIVAFNAVSLRHRLEDTGVASRRIHELADTTAALIAAGEPYSEEATVGGGIDTRFIRRLVDDGWKPPRAADPSVVRDVRRRIRLILGGDRAKRAARARDHVVPTAPGVGADGCLRLVGPSLVHLRVTGPGGFKVSRPVVITWSDRFGTVQGTAGPAVVGLARPVGRPRVTIRTSGRTRICALAPEPSRP